MTLRSRAVSCLRDAPGGAGGAAGGVEGALGPLRGGRCPGEGTLARFRNGERRARRGKGGASGAVADRRGSGVGGGGRARGGRNGDEAVPVGIRARMLLEGLLFFCIGDLSREDFHATAFGKRAMTEVLTHEDLLKSIGSQIVRSPSSWRSISLALH